MSDHDNDDCPHLVPMRLLESENARLKAEVERLKADNEQLQNRCDFLEGNEPEA